MTRWPFWGIMVLGAATVASAGLLPSPRQGPLPDAVVINEQDKSKNINDYLKADTPIFLLPAFLKCHAACPLMARALLRAENSADLGEDLRVLIFSFDPTDTLQDIARFREMQKLPSRWTILRAADDVQARTFYDALDYHYRDEQGTFAHPNQIFVFSPQGKWTLTVNGSDFGSSEIKNAIEKARLADARSSWARLNRLFGNPQTWAIVGFFGLFATIAFLATISVRRKH